MMSLVGKSATRVPTRNAPTKANIPMLTGTTVAMTNMTANARIEINSGDIRGSWLLIS